MKKTKNLGLCAVVRGEVKDILPPIEMPRNLQLTYLFLYMLLQIEFSKGKLTYAQVIFS